ncbi:carbohydrate ABC transporter permease [Paenibacillus nasutitermitis]|uniref:ABC transporter permease n=1 Tax=Paenibacillus nasutitermitis TaxID=1652958 RepID=A0A917DY33_9BACL|nr:sugar ABC transporter permease [Paenibacillus nasutitermitis]GGD79832.1 ABC transporter permease [Paenibacillus nasutitermitis]
MAASELVLHKRKQRIGVGRGGLLHQIWQARVSYLLIAPFVVVFAVFILVPIISAFGLSFTSFNGVESPEFIGWGNFKYLLSQDQIFLQHVLPNTIKFAVIVGPGGYVLAFMLAWVIAQLPGRMRIWFAMVFYAPSLAGAVVLQLVWQPLLTGDRIGYLNHYLLQLGIISEPRLWVLDPAYLMNAMIVVTLWSSMGIGFLAMMAGILNVDRTMYEAARIDGVKSRLQEIWYITIPIMKPQMLFAAVMAIVGAFKGGEIGALLSGQNPTPEYAGHLFQSHIHDHGLIRFEMGYASALSVFLLVIIYLFNKLSWRLFGAKEDE